MTRTTIPIIVSCLACAMSLCASTALACGNLFQCVGGAVVNLVKAGAEVATLGEIGRERDRQRAEAAQAAAAKEAELKQLEKTRLIQEKSQALATLDVILTGQSVSLQLADNLVGIQDQVVRQINLLLDERKRSIRLVEYVRDALRSESSETSQLLAQLTKLAPLTTAQIKGEAKPPAKAIEPLAKPVRALMAAQSARQVTMDEYLALGLKSVNTAALEALIKLSLAARGQAISIRTQLFADLKSTSDARNGKAAELKELGVTVAPLPEAVALALKADKAAGGADAASAQLSDVLRSDEFDSALSRVQWKPVALAAGHVLTPQQACQQQFAGVTLTTIANPC